MTTWESFDEYVKTADRRAPASEAAAKLFREPRATLKHEPDVNIHEATWTDTRRKS